MLDEFPPLDGTLPACQQVAHVTAIVAAGVGLVTDQIPDLAEAQPMRLRLLDEPGANDGIAVVLAEVPGRATGPREQTLSLVVAERIVRSCL